MCVKLKVYIIENVLENEVNTYIFSTEKKNKRINEGFSQILKYVQVAIAEQSRVICFFIFFYDMLMYVRMIIIIKILHSTTHP